MLFLFYNNLLSVMDIDTLHRMSNLNSLQVIIFVIIHFLCLQLFNACSFITVNQIIEDQSHFCKFGRYIAFTVIIFIAQQLTIIVDISVGSTYAIVHFRIGWNT